MATAIVSDLHLGSMSGTDLVRNPGTAARLAEALARADRVVVLGDLLELREQPVARVLETAGPALAALGEATAGKELVLVPGNHDYELVAPALERARRVGGAPLATEARFEPLPGDLAADVAALLPGTEVTLSYPAVRIRDDVVATHGHYLDLHLTVPRPESVFVKAIARWAGSDDVRRAGARATPEDYEAALAPLYAFAHRAAQSASERAATQGGSTTRAVWRAVNPDGRRPNVAELAVGRLAIPAGVAMMNAAGLGPFRADLTAVELRRAGLRAMGEVVDRLGLDGDHVIFGHTHRAGPLDGDVEGWTLPGGARLWNTGSWIYEEVFVKGAGPENPYWPGRVTWVGDEGPPWQELVLGGRA